MLKEGTPVLEESGMAESVLRIGDREFTLENATISVDSYELDDDAFLEMNVVAGDNETEHGCGVALNCLSFPGVQALEELMGKTIEVGGIDDTLNELGESVVWEPGRTLSLETLTLNILEVNEERVVLDLQATCTAVNDDTYETEDGIPVSAYLVTQVTG
jgi:hypothetical protein